MLLPLPKYVGGAKDIEDLAPGCGNTLSTGPLYLRKVRRQGFGGRVKVGILLG
jgi:hypothetical protein